MMNNKSIFALCLSIILAGGLLSFKLITNGNSVSRREAVNAGLTLPEGFRANVITDNLGSARHLVVTPQGNKYLCSSRRN
jgi:hypothetical protein